MGKEAIKVASVDVDKLLEMLNAALSEEWLAYYQYWIGARLIEGSMRSEVEPELLEHANEETHNNPPYEIRNHQREIFSSTKKLY